MFRPTFSIAVAAIVLSCAALSLAQGGTYTQFDYPGAMDTSAYGIDQAGDIVGTYVGPDGYLHGFLLSGGIFSSIDYTSKLQHNCWWDQ